MTINLILKGLIVATLLLAPATARDIKKEDVKYVLPRVLTTEEIIEQSDLYKTKESIQDTIELTEQILYAKSNKRFVKDTNRQIQQEISDDSLHICTLHPIGFVGSMVGTHSR